jgi:heme/copper-type cytochrome/quinol oxidase subunit 3
MAHVPLFAVVMVFVASANSGTRLLARKVVCSFMIIHGALHIVFTGHSAYEFSSLTSDLLIFGAALCGLSFFMVRLLPKKVDVS